MSQPKPVLVVVDVQNGFITEHSQPVVAIIIDLVHRWQAAGGDVVFSRYLNYPNSPFERLIGWTKMIEGPETDLVEERDWTDLYVCGIDTDICVLKTAVDVFERDLTPWVIEDACASHAGPEAHHAGLFVARRFIGTNQIIRTADIPEEMLASPI